MQQLPTPFNLVATSETRQVQQLCYTWRLTKKTQLCYVFMFYLIDLHMLQPLEPAHPALCINCISDIDI